jgi:hypothetical protein
VETAIEPHSPLFIPVVPFSMPEAKLEMSAPKAKEANKIATKRKIFLMI